ncbi:hypothetical protein BJY01DRAFT_238886 [Aspergillus pseudoustus]|uniref:TRP C-terminal domain-containing protein n=1 Tax=Aspergillus pseudoustus TaxID=1810923 RepID=A0ABR4J8H5_9EURO
MFTLILTALLLLLPHWAVAEPIQYYRFSYYKSLGATVDFCMGIIMHYNAYSADHNMYISLQIIKHIALGWTAVGIGSMIQGSLIFIVYGDPFSSGHEAPVPRLLSQNNMGLVTDLRLLQANWVPITPSRANELKGPILRNGAKSIAKIALVCYSCGQWPGLYSYDVQLDMHRHHASSGGWGRFYMDMARSISHGRSPPSLPPIRPGVASLGASETFGGEPWNWTDPIVYIHGVLLAIVFLILFPAGVLVTTSALFIAGVALGLVKTIRARPDCPLYLYHWIGLTLTLCISPRMRLAGATTYSLCKVRGVLLLSWANVIVGLLLTGRGRPLVALAAALICLDCVVLLGWVYYCSARRRRRQGLGLEDTLGLRSFRRAGNEYFSLGLDDEDEDAYDGDSADGFRSSSGNDSDPLLSTAEKE